MSSNNNKNTENKNVQIINKTIEIQKDKEDEDDDLTKKCRSTKYRRLNKNICKLNHMN